MQINPYSTRVLFTPQVKPKQYQDLHFASSASWRTPGVFARLAPKLTLACMATLPFNPAVQAVVQQKPAAAVSALESSENIPINTASFIALTGLLGLLATRKSASLGHELGHVMGNRQIARDSGFDQLDGSLSYPVLSNSGFLQYTNPYSRAWFNYGIHLQKECDQAAKEGLLFTDAYAEKRERLIKMLREVNIIAEAGHLLEGYLKGYEIPGNAPIDHLTVFQNAPRIARLLKPKEDWKPLELARFVLAEKCRAEEEARALLTNYDRSQVQTVYETLLGQAKQGKNVWTRSELEALLEAL